MIQRASRFDLTLRRLLGSLSTVLNAAADQPGESRMTPGETSYGGPPTGTTLHIKRPREPHCRIIAIGAGGSVCIPSVLTSFCWLLIFLLLLLPLRRARSRCPFRPTAFLSLSPCVSSSSPATVFHRLLPPTSSFALHLSMLLPLYSVLPCLNSFCSCFTFEIFHEIFFTARII